MKPKIKAYSPKYRLWFNETEVRDFLVENNWISISQAEVRKNAFLQALTPFRRKHEAKD